MIIECPICKSRDDYGKYVSVSFKRLEPDQKPLKVSKIDCTGCGGIVEWVEEIYSVIVKERMTQDSLQNKELNIAYWEWVRMTYDQIKEYRIIQYDDVNCKLTVRRK